MLAECHVYLLMTNILSVPTLILFVMSTYLLSVWCEKSVRFIFDRYAEFLSQKCAPWLSQKLRWGHGPLLPPPIIALLRTSWEVVVGEGAEWQNTQPRSVKAVLRIIELGTMRAHLPNGREYWLGCLWYLPSGWTGHRRPSPAMGIKAQAYPRHHSLHAGSEVTVQAIRPSTEPPMGQPGKIQSHRILHVNLEEINLAQTIDQWLVYLVYAFLNVLLPFLNAPLYFQR